MLSVGSLRNATFAYMLCMNLLSLSLSLFYVLKTSLFKFGDIECIIFKFCLICLNKLIKKNRVKNNLFLFLKVDKKIFLLLLLIVQIHHTLPFFSLRSNSLFTVGSFHFCVVYFWISSLSKVEPIQAVTLYFY